jgi:hypothetical protein
MSPAIRFDLIVFGVTMLERIPSNPAIRQLRAKRSQISKVFLVIA